MALNDQTKHQRSAVTDLGQGTYTRGVTAGMTVRDSEESASGESHVIYFDLRFSCDSVATPYTALEDNRTGEELRCQIEKTVTVINSNPYNHYTSLTKEKGRSQSSKRKWKVWRKKKMRRHWTICGKTSNLYERKGKPYCFIWIFAEVQA